MNPLKSMLGRKDQDKKVESSKVSDKKKKSSRPRRTRSHDLCSSTNSTDSMGSSSGNAAPRRVTRTRMGSHNQKHAPMHPTDMIALLERRASLGPNMGEAMHMFEQMKMGETSGDFEPDSDTEAY